MLQAKGGYGPIVGTYTIGFEVAGDSAASRNVLATVTAGQPPTLTAPAFTQLNVGGSFNPRTGVVATDVEDDDTILTNSVVVSGSVDVNTAGIYRLNYTVTDSDGNTATASQTVLVNDGSYKAGANYILKATDFTKRISEVDTSPLAIKLASNVKVYSKATGLEDIGAVVNVVSTGGYTAVAGTYNITFEVATDTTARHTIVATVEGGLPPMIFTPGFTEINKNDPFDPKAGVTATDPEDGDFAVGDITVTGTVDTSQAGVYTLTYSVTDSDGNIATAKQVVLVNDGTFAVGATHMLKADDFTKLIGEVDTSDEAIKAASNVKVYSKTTGLEDLTAAVAVTDKDGYTAAAGNFNIQMEVVTDPTAKRTVVATVEAGEPPVLTVPAFTEVSLNGSFNPLTGVTADDPENGDLTEAVLINGSVDITVAGVYTLNYSVTDRDGNTDTAKQVVLVNDGNFKAGSTYIIGAQDFAVGLGHVDDTDTGMITSASVKTYEIATGDETVVPNVNIADDGGYRQAYGSYDITFEVVGDTGANVTITGEVVTGEIPVLTIANTFTEISVGGSFDPLTGVSATDVEDDVVLGGVTIDVTNPVDVDTPGVYLVEYSVTDSDLNTVTGTQTVLVNDGSFQVGSTFILQASDFTKRVGQVDPVASAIRTAAQAKVYSLTTGALVPSATVNVTNQGGYGPVVGGYNIVLEVGGDSAATKTVLATVEAGDAPVLTVPAFTQITKGTPFDSMDNVTVTDTEDDDAVLLSEIQTTGVIDSNTAGVYTIEYSVTDSDLNTVTATQVVLVNDGTFAIGANYLLQASDFTKFVGEVDTSDVAIKTAAGVKVYSKTTGLEDTVTPVNITNDGGYAAVPNDYNITFQVQGDAAAERTILAEVTAGNEPELTVPAFTEITVGGYFDPTDGVSATDVEDGDFLLGDITITGTVDVNTAGVYTLTYSVTDSDGNTVTATQVVLVNDGSFVAGTNYLLQASDFTKRVGEVDTSDAAIKTAAGVKVYSKTTGLEDGVATVKNKGGYTATPGTYNISFEVTGDTAATKTIIGEVITGSMPTLTVPAFTEIAMGGAFDPTNGVSATDAEDGDFLIGEIDITGTVDVNTAGVYTLNYSVTDTDGNEATATQVVLVNDGTLVAGATHILQAGDFTKRVGQVDTDSAAIKIAAGVKVYNKLTGAEDILAAVNIKSTGGYTAVAGTYTIGFEVVVDTTATKNITATVETGDVPTLTVPSFTEISVGDTFDKLTGVSVSDTEDGTIANSQITITGSVDTNVAGVYPLNYSVKDSDGNEATATQVVVVNDGSIVAGTTHILLAKDFTILEEFVDLSPEAIKAAAKAEAFDRFTGLEDTGVTIDIIDDGGYAPVAGTYQITFEVSTDPGAIRTITVTVTSNTPPELTVPEFTEIGINSNFDPLDGVVATDYEEGDLIGSVEITGQVDVSKAGIYVLNYSLTDRDGNQVTARQVVLVNDGSFVYDNGYIISAKDFSVGESQANLTDAQMKERANASVYDVLNAQVIENSEITVDRGGYEPKEGKYPIIFTFNPTITVVATVYDDTPAVPETPKANKPVVKTGDDMSLLGLSSLLLMGLIGLMVVNRKKRKEN